VKGAADGQYGCVGEIIKDFAPYWAHAPRPTEGHAELGVANGLVAEGRRV